MKKKKKKRVVQYAPNPEEDQGQNGKSGSNDPDPWSDEWQSMDPFAKVRFAQSTLSRRNSILHMDIYSRRNMLSSIDREVRRPLPPGRVEPGTGIRKPPQLEVDQPLSPVEEKFEDKRSNDGESVENKNVKFQTAEVHKFEIDRTEVEDKLRDIKDMEKMVEQPQSPLPTPVKSGRSRGRMKTPKRRPNLPPATAPVPSGEREEDNEETESEHGKPDILVIERDGSKTPKAREISRAPVDNERVRPKTQGAETSVGFLGKLADGFHHKTPGRDKDFMKDLLHNNARRRYRKKKKDPIEDRLKAFYTKMDDVKRRADEDAAAPISQEAMRKWTMLTKGIDAALAESSDEEENKKTTI